jgi:hypothetical protein
MVLDLFGVTNDMAARIVPLNTAGIASARLGLYPEKIRIVLDAVSGIFPPSRVVTTAEGILLVSDQDTAAEQADLLAEQKKAEVLPAREAAERRPQTVKKLPQKKQQLR